MCLTLCEVRTRADIDHYIKSTSEKMVDKQVTKQERIETTIVVHLSASYLSFSKNRINFIYYT